ncbi:hypothetical protein [Streptomyces chartreusis]
MDAYLAKPCQGFGARRAHYTIAALIALERPIPDSTETTPSSPAHHGLDQDDPLESATSAAGRLGAAPNLGQRPGRRRPRTPPHRRRLAIAKWK